MLAKILSLFACILALQAGLVAHADEANLPGASKSSQVDKLSARIDVQLNELKGLRAKLALSKHQFEIGRYVVVGGVAYVAITGTAAAIYKSINGTITILGEFRGPAFSPKIFIPGLIAIPGGGGYWYLKAKDIEDLLTQTDLLESELQVSLATLDHLKNSQN